MTRRHELALLVALLAACQEPPSFRVRWDLVDRDGGRVDVARAIDCTELGINAVQVTSIDGLGEIADQRVYPCFTPRFEEPDGNVGGPALPAGPYAIEVRGVQRNGAPWVLEVPEDPGASPCDPNVADEDIACQPWDVACDCLRFDAVDDQTQDLGTARLGPAPRECVDGIDNDHDGLVDGQELICSRDPDSFEANNVSIVQFSLLTTVWDGAPEVSCGELLLSSIAARLCRYEGDVPSCGATPIATPACIADAPVFFQGEADAGTYAIELTGLDASGNARTHPQLSEPFVVDSTGIGATVTLTADFGADDFLAQVNSPIRFGIAYEQGPGLGLRDECDPSSGQGYGGLALAQLVYELRDAHGGALDTPIAVGSPPGPTFDGEPFACVQEEIESAYVDWGGYSVRVDALAEDGTVCFTTGDAVLSLFPGSNTLVVPRVLDGDGVPPASCRDCGENAAQSPECGSLYDCSNGVCQRP